MRHIGMTALIILLSAVGPLAHAQTPASPDASQYGWLEGTITNSDGAAISGQRFTRIGKHIKGIRQGGGEFDVQSDLQLGGLYSVNNIRPGIYDITLEAGYIKRCRLLPGANFWRGGQAKPAYNFENCYGSRRNL